MKISKNTMLLGGAVGLGLLCFFGAQYYLHNYLTNAEKRLAGEYETRPVIVAATEIESGTVVSADNLAVRKIPARYLSSNTLSPDDLDRVTGQRVVTSLKPGDPLYLGGLEGSDRPALSTTVAKGERAITVPVDEVSSISGMLVPGDVIDLLFVGPGLTDNSYLASSGNVVGGEQAKPKELTHVRPLLQSVTVMATGKITKKRVVQAQDGTQHEENAEFSTVTLKVTPDQAEKVLIAQKVGQLTAVLRNADDAVPMRSTALDETTFKQVADGPSGRGNYVEMYVGGGSGVEKTQEQVGTALMSSLAKNSLGIASSGKAINAGDIKSRLGISADTGGNTNGNTNANNYSSRNTSR
ncbi:flp pilus assembly protein CpaB [Collimonas arenae]|uniref:Flp pilus assembly protein CpaB n=1 Tax=Collimonas arenae TaxID=279058 RepID=A0A127PSI0_9BURK|nr:Flp pilus assembly protein CpaB [Collimonas arenae]AMP00716.1 flp pilus assembly protein CpaB [Collimonas arenae]AMP10606.1 flp pilus assembly protein CpaB [Collimonas arenae]